MGGTIVAATCPLGTIVSTRSAAANVIDNFVVSNGLAPAAAAPVPGWPGKPHKLIALQLAGDITIIINALSLNNILRCRLTYVSSLFWTFSTS